VPRKRGGGGFGSVNRGCLDHASGELSRRPDRNQKAGNLVDMDCGRLKDRSTGPREGGGDDRGNKGWAAVSCFTRGGLHAPDSIARRVDVIKGRKGQLKAGQITALGVQPLFVDIILKRIGAIQAGACGTRKGKRKPDGFCDPCYR